MTVLLDTNVIVDVLNARRGRMEFVRRLAEEGHLLACCAITVAEVYAGMRAHEAEATEEFLARLDYFEASRSVARRAGALKATWARKGHTLGLPDAMIAAIVLEHRLVLATDNRKDFPMPEIQLIAPPALH